MRIGVLTGIDRPCERLTIPIFSAICRTFRSGGTRIRTGDTMIFGHVRKPLDMRICRIGMRIYVHRVPVDTSWFCPYCCATVDTAFVSLQRHRKRDAYICLPNSSIGLLSPSAILRRRIGVHPQREVGGLHHLPHHPYRHLIQRLQIRLNSQLGLEGF
jgi:hypothetical protein